MAKQNRSGGGGEIIALMLFGALFFVAIIAPIILVVAWVVTEMRGASSAFRRSASARFATSSEVANLTRLTRSESKKEAEIEALLQQGDENEIPRRQYDGLFDGRSSLGRTLNQRIESLTEDKTEITNEWGVIDAGIETRQSNWIKRVSQRAAARWAVVAWILGIAGSKVVWPHAKIIPDKGIPLPLVVAGLSCVVVAALAYWIKANRCAKSLLDENHDSTVSAMAPDITR
ncbi:hypothetical protein ACVWZA_001328 [Sphingomonas sp. UYAg733]